MTNKPEVSEQDGQQAAKIVTAWGMNDRNDPHEWDALRGRIATALASERAAERENCATTCDAIAGTLAPLGIGRKVAEECAFAIRNQSESTTAEPELGR